MDDDRDHDERQREGVAASPHADDLVARIAAVGALGVEGPEANAAADALAAVAADAARLLDAGPDDVAP